MEVDLDLPTNQYGITLQKFSHNSAVTYLIDDGETQLYYINCYTYRELFVIDSDKHDRLISDYFIVRIIARFISTMEQYNRFKDMEFAEWYEHYWDLVRRLIKKLISSIDDCSPSLQDQ